jgi:hypothetical protein
MEETVRWRELLRGWWRPISLMVSFMIFTASVRNILDSTSYVHIYKYFTALNSNLGRKAAHMGHAERCLTSRRSKPVDFQYVTPGTQVKECSSQTPSVEQRTYVQLNPRTCTDKPSCKQKWMTTHNNGREDMLYLGPLARTRTTVRSQLQHFS